MARSQCSMLLLAALLCGCSSLSYLPTAEQASMESGRKAGKDELTTPVRCLCLWQPIEGTDDSGKKRRAIGGQVYFFSANDERPVAVNGDVRIFVFDDIGTPEEQARPIDTADFDSTEWNSLLSESQFGPVYSVVMPYTRRGNLETTCSLRVRLKGPNGSTLHSDMASVKLTGTPRDEKTVRKLSLPKEQPIDNDRGRELRVDLLDRSEDHSRAATIGQRLDGEFVAHGSTARGFQAASTLNAQAPKDSRDRRIQELERQLAAMHAEFIAQEPPTSTGPDSRSDDLPDDGGVIRARFETSQSHPSAREVFAGGWDD